MRFKFKLPPGCDIQEAVLRETNGADEAAAIAIAKSKGVEGSMLNELMSMAICVVDGMEAIQPFDGPSKWNSKTRGLVLKAFMKINGASEKEEKDFLDGGEPLPD